MINANTLYKFVEFIGNQYQSGRISPDEFNLAWERAEREYLNSIFTTGRVMQQGSAGGTDAEKDVLRVLRKNATLTNDKYGRVSLPQDYLRWDALYRITGVGQGDPVQLISQDQWASRSSSKLNPTSKYPVAKLEGNEVMVLPVSTRYNLSYIRTPVQPKWAFTLDGFNRPVYSAGSSINSELPEYLTNEIAFRICSYLGINISKAELVQYSEMKAQ